MPTSARSPIPAFYLYGEPHRVVDEQFVHLEALDDRSRPSEWTIRPHRHAALNHLFLVMSGGGEFESDEGHIGFAAPCLVVVPAGAVHAFAWATESAGSVITLSTGYLNGLCSPERELGAVFRRPAVIQLDPVRAERASRRVADLMIELSWATKAHRAAVDAGLLDLMVLAARGADTAETGDGPPSRAAALVAAFRQRIEERFRRRESVQSHAEALGVTPGRLRNACALVACQSPIQILDQRTVLEARRVLLYTNLSIAELAYSLGFDDTAYFSRFFRRQTGLGPRAFREDTLGQTPGSGNT